MHALDRELDSENAFLAYPHMVVDSEPFVTMHRKCGTYFQLISAYQAEEISSDVLKKKLKIDLEVFFFTRDRSRKSKTVPCTLELILKGFSTIEIRFY